MSKYSPALLANPYPGPDPNSPHPPGPWKTKPSNPRPPCPATQIAPGAEEEQGSAIGEIVAVVMEYRWLIAAITAFSILLGGALPLRRQAGLQGRRPAAGRRKSGGGMSAALKTSSSCWATAPPCLPSRRSSPPAWCWAASSTASSSTSKSSPRPSSLAPPSPAATWVPGAQ